MVLVGVDLTALMDSGPHVILGNVLIVLMVLSGLIALPVLLGRTVRTVLPILLISQVSQLPHPVHNTPKSHLFTFG